MSGAYRVEKQHNGILKDSCVNGLKSVEEVQKFFVTMADIATRLGWRHFEQVHNGVTHELVILNPSGRLTYSRVRES